jgi:PhnB protein
LISKKFPKGKGTMPTILNPYINFKDNARQAIEFYHSVLGGKLTLSTFKEFQASQEPGEDNLIMHAMLETEHGITLMAADTPTRMEYRPGTNISMSLSGTDEAELTSFFQKLSDGGMVSQPLTKAPWGDTFGMFTDKFGVGWLVNITASH